jgi:2-iminobutanoate/2-iminopropanoate deaminase
VDSGETVYLSGQVGINPETGSLHEGLQAQARQALSNLESLLTEAGLTKDSVVRATVYLDDINNYPALNEVYGQFFEDVDVKPSRSTVGVAALPIGAAVEIDFIAVK